MNRETRKHVRAAEDLLDSRLSFHRKNLETALCREIVTIGEAALEAITALKSDLITAEEKLEGIARVLKIGAEAAGVDTDPDPQACPTCLQMADDYKGSHEAGWTFMCPSGHEWSDTRDVAPEPEPEPEPKPEPEPAPIIWDACWSCGSTEDPHTMLVPGSARGLWGVCPACFLNREGKRS